MSEQAMRQRVVRALKVLDAFSVENPAYPGTPDLNYVEGWIECKWLRHWPKRANTVVKLQHELMKHQQVWLERRRRAGGQAWVMLQCGREWLLFDGATAGRIIGQGTRQQLLDSASRVWTNGLVDEELVEYLKCNLTTANQSTS
jgi:hypothetical protein